MSTDKRQINFGEKEISAKKMLKLENAKSFIDYISECISGGKRPEPVYIKETYQTLKKVFAREPGLFTGKLVYLWESLGWGYHLLGDMRKTEECLRIQAKLHPHKPDPYINLGAFCEDGGMYDKAVTVYLEGLNHFPADEHLSFNLAGMLRDQGMQENALRYINEAIMKNPHKAFNYKLKGDIYLDCSNPAKAIAYYKKFLELFGANSSTFKSEALINLTIACKKLGLPGESLSYLKEALEVEPFNTAVLFQIGQTYIEQEQYDQAIVPLKKLLDIEPDNAEACLLLSQCYFKNGNRDMFKWYQHRGRKKQ